jgi:hypothetical protein
VLLQGPVEQCRFWLPARIGHWAMRRRETA